MRTTAYSGVLLQLVLSIIGGLFLLQARPIAAEPLAAQEAVIVPRSQRPFLQFGRSVALSGDGRTLIVGSDKNTAFIYRFTNAGWQQVQRLAKPKGLECNNNGAYFSAAVAISDDGTTAMVGASGILTIDSDGIPIDTFLSCRNLAIYNLQGSKWVLQTLISPTQAGANDLFGSAIALSGGGNRAIVGAERSQCASGTDTCGAVYFFERKANNWLLRNRILSEQTFNAQSGFFGATTAISANGRWAVTGAPGGKKAWIFQRKSGPVRWEPVAALQFPDSRLAVEFGTAVALSGRGTWAVISAQSAGGNDDCQGDFSHCGAAYSFVRNANVWSFERSFTAADSHSFNYFGGSLALSADGNRVVVGTTEADCANGNCGAAYIFNWDGSKWVQRDRVTSPTAGSGGYLLGAKFGGAVTVDRSGTHFLVSAREENCSAGMGCGSVYQYSLGR